MKRAVALLLTGLLVLSPCDGLSALQVRATGTAEQDITAGEEAKADVCGLFLTEQLIERGEITNTTVNQNYITFINK